MGRTSGDRLTPEVAREVCLRTSSKVMLAGSISGLGSEYVIGLKALNCSSGDMLTQEQVQAVTKEGVLKALDRAATSLREKLGESLSTVHRFDMPLSQATTPSLEALKAFTLGDVQHAILFEDLASIPLFQRAIELDPNFALAYARLSSVYENLGQLDKAEQYSSKAFELRDRSSERERLYITAHHYWDSRQLQKSLAAWEIYQQTYPHDPIAWDNLGVFNEQLGHFDKSLDCAKEEIRLEPDSAGGYVVSADAYRGLNRLQDAKTIIDVALKRGIRSWWLGYEKLLIALVQHDPSAEEQARMLLKASPEGEFNLLITDENLALSRGKLHNGHALLAKVEKTAADQNLKETAADAFASAALFDALVGKPKDAAADAQTALAMARPPIPTMEAAAALALAGYSRKAEALASLVTQRRINDEEVQSTFGPLVRAATLLQHRNPTAVIDTLQSVSPFDATNTSILLFRGTAYLQAHDPNDAIQDFRRIESLHSLYPQDPLSPLAYLGLGRVYTLQGETANSRTAYQNFLGQWKDADPDIPILKQAKAEYAKLQ